jgi:hypothetical protein
MAETTAETLDALRDTVRKFPGTRPLVLEFARENGTTVRVQCGVEYRVNLAPGLREQLAAWLKE